MNKLYILRRILEFYSKLLFKKLNAGNFKLIKIVLSSIYVNRRAKVLRESGILAGSGLILNK